MLPPQLALEWKAWILLNGLPAIVATLGFLLVPSFAFRFGWNVTPRASGILMGVGFLMRAAMYVQQFTATHYQEMRWLHWGNVVFAAVLLGVTCVWGDAFHWRRFIAIAWLFLYIEEPVWMLTLLPQSEAAIAGQAVLPGGAINLFLKAGLFVEAVIGLVYGVGVFFIRRFPNLLSWQPDEVSARILAGWYLSYAVWAPTLALASSFGESRGGILVNIVWLVSTVLALLIWRKDFDLSHRATRAMLLVSAALAVWLSIGVLIQ
jgi:hypothetical protein